MTLLGRIHFSRSIDVPLDKVITTATFFVAVLIGGWIVYRIGRMVIRRAGMPKPLLRPEAAARAETARALLLSVWKYVVMLGVLAALLTQLPRALVPTVAITSAVGLTIAFGAQWLFRDVIAGFSILMEGQFVVGDRVRVYGVDVEGTVEGIGLRITVIRDDDGSRVFIPNGTITAIRSLPTAPAEDERRRASRSRGGRGRGRERAAGAGTRGTEGAGRPPRVARPSREAAPEPAAGETPPAASAGPDVPAPPRETQPSAPIFELARTRPASDGEEAQAGDAEPAAARGSRSRGRRGRGGRRPSRRPAAQRAGSATGEADADKGDEKESVGEPHDVLDESPWSIE